MTQKIEYRAGTAAAWIVNGPDFIEYDCGPMQHAKIAKSQIVAVGVMDPSAVVLTRHLQSVFEALGTKGALGGVLITYRKHGASKPTLATITVDLGDAECQRFISDIVEEYKQQFVGMGGRGLLMKAMGVSRLKENLLIAAIILGIVGFATIKAL